MPYAVCAYCQSVVQREGDAGREIGKAAVLPFDVSPIQLGTSGRAMGQSFEVVGRVRWGWSDGSWNEWLLRQANGAHMWLGEAMGLFQLLAERDDVLDDPLLVGFSHGQPVPLGSRIQVGERLYAAADIKQAECLGGEGDLPFPTPASWTMTSIDFRSEDGGSLSVQRDSTMISAYEGAYIALADLSPRNLRRIEGWAMPDALK
jgi:hypothetical protein